MTLKIMPLGDSITRGTGFLGGYRNELWNRFQSFNVDVDFVGSASDGPDSLPDKNHQGSSGFRIDQVASSVNNWLALNPPDVVLLMIGTNDVIKEYFPETAPDRLSALIDQIISQVPTVQVVVASIPPTTNPADYQQVLDYNAAIPGIVAAKVAEGKNVAFADVFSALQPTDLGDGVHPNEFGYSKLASVWYDAVVAATGLAPTPSIDIFGTPDPETLIGSAANENLFGNDGDDVLEGGAGYDSLFGEAGNDTLYGRARDYDKLLGGSGDDTYIIETASHRIIEAADEGIDTVIAATTYTLEQNVENLTLTGNIRMDGYGNALDNTITGSGSNNILDGKAGSDRLIGGSGNDTYFLDVETDVVVELIKGGTDQVRATFSYTLGDNVEQLMLLGSAAEGVGNSLNNRMTGNAADNFLSALSGDDTLDGGAGNDTLIGGSGKDTLIGGSGDDLMTGGVALDKFVFNSGNRFVSADLGIDTITDFATGTDKIVLDKSTFRALASIQGTGFSVSTEFATVGSDEEAATSQALIVYSLGTGNLFYNSDGQAEGADTLSQFAALTSAPAIVARDFMIQN